MLRYVLKRLFYGMLVILGVIITLTFLFFSFLARDGKAVYEMTGQNTGGDAILRIRKEYALDEPVWKQVLLYMNDISPVSVHHATDPENHTFLEPGKYRAARLFSAGGSAVVIKYPYFRRSYQSNRKVSDIIADVLPTTIVLALASMAFATFAGILLGVLAALLRNSWYDRMILLLSTMGVALPSFFAAVIVSWLFGFLLHRYTGLNTWGNLYAVDDFTGAYSIRLRNLLLPAFTLGIRPLSVVVQLTRNSMLEVLSMDYVRTAKAKGLARSTVVLRHSLRNALNPVITAISGWLGGLLAGAVFVEYIFGWKGIGKEIVDGLQKLDYPVVMGAVIVVSSMFVVINILVDFIYGIVDPRIRMS